MLTEIQDGTFAEEVDRRERERAVPGSTKTRQSEQSIADREGRRQAARDDAVPEAGESHAGVGPGGSGQQVISG